MDEILTNFPIEIVLVSANIIIFTIMLIVTIKNSSKLKKLKLKYNKFMEGLSDRNIEELLDSCLDELKELKAKNRDIENHINYIERNVVQCVQKIGVVRFNAFDNVGSDLSFSVAMLDSNDNGVILSSIYSRDNSTVYAKPVVGGKTKYALSAEEIQALDIAKKSFSEGLYLSERHEKK